MWARNLQPNRHDAGSSTIEWRRGALFSGFVALKNCLRANNSHEIMIDLRALPEPILLLVVL